MSDAFDDHDRSRIPKLEVLEKNKKVGTRELELEEMVRRLQAEVLHYRGLLKETQALLARLQDGVAVEEAKWVSQIAEKDREIQRIKGIEISWNSWYKEGEEFFKRSAAEENEGALNGNQD